FRSGRSGVEGHADAGALLCHTVGLSPASDPEHHRCRGISIAADSSRRIAQFELSVELRIGAGDRRNCHPTDATRHAALSSRPTKYRDNKLRRVPSSPHGPVAIGLAPCCRTSGEVHWSANSLAYDGVGWTWSIDRLRFPADLGDPADWAD